MKRGDLPWVRHFPRRFLLSVRGLEPVEIGILVLLTNTMLDRGGPIDGSDERRLARLCGTTPATFRKALAHLVAGDLIRSEAGFLSNREAVEELAHREEFSAAQRDRINRRWAAKRNENNGRPIPRQIPDGYPVQGQREKEKEKPARPVEIPAVSGMEPQAAATLWAASDVPLPEIRTSVPEASPTLRAMLSSGGRR